MASDTIASSETMRLLASKAYLSTLELQQIKSTASTVDADISEAEAQLAKIKSDLEQKHKFRRQLSALTSNIRRVPPEVWAEIFYQCRPGLSQPYSWQDAPSSTPLPHRSNNGPLLVLCVCKSWRDIALSTPRLWSDMVQTFTVIDATVGIRDFLQRAGSLPLSIDMGTLQNQVDLTFLNSFLPRTHSLKLHARGSTVNTLVFDDCPVLETLDVEYASPRRTNNMLLSLLPISAPRLHTFRLRTSKYHLFHHQLSHLLPNSPLDSFNNLTHLVIEVWYNCADYICILGHCNVCLIECSLFVADDTEEGGTIPLTFPELQSLSLTVQGNATRLLAAISAPKLRKLLTDQTRINSTDFVNEAPHPWNATTHCKELILRSTCTLGELSLIQTPMFANDLVQLFAGTSSITRLKLVQHDGGETEMVFLFNAMEAMGMRVLPNLEDLHVGYNHHSVVDPVIAFVESRGWRSAMMGADGIVTEDQDGTAPGSLKKVYISRMRSQEEEINVQAIAELSSRGLEIGMHLLM